MANWQPLVKARASEAMRSTGRFEREGASMSDGWRRFFPAGSLDPRSELHRMRAEYYADALERLGEPPLQPGNRDWPLVVRLLCLPTWSPACSVLAERSGLTWRLIARELDGAESGFDLGELAHREERLLTTADAARVEEMWAYLDFWSLDLRTDGDDVLDGTTYVIEAADQGRYHVVPRDDPEWGDTFGEFADLLVRLAGLLPR